MKAGDLKFVLKDVDDDDEIFLFDSRTEDHYKPSSFDQITVAKYHYVKTFMGESSPSDETYWSQVNGNSNPSDREIERKTVYWLY